MDLCKNFPFTEAMGPNAENRWPSKMSSPSEVLTQRRPLRSRVVLLTKELDMPSLTVSIRISNPENIS